jgi:hypothetical protein
MADLVFEAASSKVETSAGVKKDGFAVFTLPDENIDDFADLPVYTQLIVDFDPDADNFSSQIARPFGFVDLEECIVYDEKSGREHFAQLLDDMEEEADDKEALEGHPIIRPSNPICPWHFAVVLHPTKNFPQVVGSDLLEEMLLVACCFPEHNVVLGFNSLNAGATQNKLHVEGLCLDKIPLVDSTLLRGQQSVSVFESSLLPKDGQEDSLVDSDLPVQCWS